MGIIIFLIGCVIGIAMIIKEVFAYSSKLDVERQAKTERRNKYFDEYQQNESHRAEMLQKAKRVGRHDELQSLYNQQQRIAMSLGLHFEPLKPTTHDPYIRGGAASAIGGAGLGLYTAIKTDEENKANQQQYEDSMKNFYESRTSMESEIEKVKRKIYQLEKTIEEELQKK